MAELSRESYEYGEKAGYADGEKRFAKLAQVFLDAGRIEDLSRATTDKEYREKIYREYEI